MLNEKIWKIWFRDGSRVPETMGGLNYINSVAELRSLASKYDFDAGEVLSCGETEMIDENGDVVGGVLVDSFLTQ
tara:strand:- start:48 stop:272 length:225 start_codon:yes stop_codon:yes gene_type:complete